MAYCIVLVAWAWGYLPEDSRVALRLARVALIHHRGLPLESSCKGHLTDHTP